jgi:hypothetical protein
MLHNNEIVPMTRRYPDLSQKVLRRDSEVVKKLVSIDDTNKDGVFELFLKEHKNLSDYRYWELLRTVWILTGTMERKEQFKKWFTSNRKHKYYFSTPEEAKRLRELEFPITIYRATNDENDGGFSWTLSYEYAEHYKNSFNRLKIISRTANKEDVFAFIERNKEEEILIIT